MRYYYREKDWLYIGFDYRPYLVEAMKKFNASYNYATKEWYIRLGLDNSLRIKGFLESNDFEEKRVYQPQEIQLKHIQEHVTRNDVEEMLDYINLPIKLRDYQIDGVTYMVNHDNCINGCAMGLGKSATAIATVELLNLFPCLIVCPATVKKSWEKEWKKVSPKRTVHIIDSKDGDDLDWKVDVTIINYDYLFKKNKKGEDIKLRYRSLSKKWGSVVLDEIHLCKNSKTMRSKAVSKIVKKAHRVYALSGTLIQNRPQELINTLNILGRFKDIFPDLRYFLYRYCNAKKTRFGLDCSGATYTLELHNILKHYCYYRKERNEVLKELPEVIEQTIECDITNKKEYQKAQDDFIEWLSSINEEAAERALRAEHLVRLSALKDLSIKGKTKFISSFLKEWKEISQEEKLIVFGVRSEPLKILQKEFSEDSVLVIGEQVTSEKMKRVEEFKSSKQFIFANIATLSTGIDGLQQCCSNMLFIELPPRPSDLEQAKARIDRMGQKEEMNIYYILSNDTIDMDLKEVIEEKTVITDAVNKGQNASSNEDQSTDWALIHKLRSKNRTK
jgi:SWI/SNF-related matrix-associated actin-dependent regulator 1 of chromatin subfamily A